MVGKYRTTGGRWSDSHFASLLPADQQSGDAHHHGNEEHAGADAFDHTTQRFCGTEKKQKNLSVPEKGGACCVEEEVKRSLGSPASVTTGSDRKVSVKRGGAAVTAAATSLLSSSNS